MGLVVGGTFTPFVKTVLGWFENKRGAALGLTATLGAFTTVGTPSACSPVSR